MLRLPCALIRPGREHLGGGAACDRHHPFIRLRATGGAHSTRLKGEAHLQGSAGSVVSTCHDGLLAPVARGCQGATPCAAVPRETRPHSRDAVVSVECSSKTLPACWQLCRKCKYSPLWGSCDCGVESVWIDRSGSEPRLDASMDTRGGLELVEEGLVVNVVERSNILIPLSITHR
jgi:hypothetical protein